jgi:hypothetical protein
MKCFSWLDRILSSIKEYLSYCGFLYHIAQEGVEINHDKGVQIVGIRSVFTSRDSRKRGSSADNHSDTFRCASVHLAKKILLLLSKQMKIHRTPDRRPRCGCRFCSRAIIFNYLEAANGFQIGWWCPKCTCYDSYHVESTNAICYSWLAWRMFSRNNKQRFVLVI